jgi:serine phosphatase RsbU (regulator of sigma subunit)
MPLSAHDMMRVVRQVDPTAVPDALHSLGVGLGGTDLVVYLVDFEQRELMPVPDRAAHAKAPEPQPVASSPAGRCFTEQRVVIAQADDGIRVWAPIVEGSDRTGVLAVTMRESGEMTQDDCQDLAHFAGYLIATLARTTDLYNLYRRRHSMTLAASIQWDLLPPLSLSSPQLITAGALEPAYHVGGDSFDYALNENSFHLAIVDAAGHGIGAALVSVLAVGSYRHDRREGLRVVDIHANLDEVIATHHPSRTFATGQLAHVDLATGTMSWTNAGHPLPLLVRSGTLERELACQPTLPWGFGRLAEERSVPTAEEDLVPGDRVLFYTDGVVEARNREGEYFGVERLTRLVCEHSAESLPPEEVVRKIVKAVIDHKVEPLSDDATLALFQWNGPSP